jgi:hypothetical protein
VLPLDKRAALEKVVDEATMRWQITVEHPSLSAVYVRRSSATSPVWAVSEVLHYVDKEKGVRLDEVTFKCEPVRRSVT